MELEIKLYTTFCPGIAVWRSTNLRELALSGVASARSNVANAVVDDGEAGRSEFKPIDVRVNQQDDG